MGLLRTLYAVAVIFAHSWPTGFMFVGGQNAVQCFYIISGFLISYILVEKRSYPTLGAFYLNRYLRLYPIYIVVALLALTVLLALHRASFIDVYKDSPPAAVALLSFTNTFLIGQDWILFLGVKQHALTFVTSFLKSDVLLYQGQIIHPSWTLGLELTFYAIAPFILPRRKLLYALLILSLLLRWVLLHAGLGRHDPWTYRFFPTELALFVLGALAHQVLLPLYQRMPAPRLAGTATAATWFLVAFSVVYFLIPIEETYKRLLLLALFTGLVPLTFLFQQRHRFDGWIGNLSYPVYICHILVLWVCSFGLKHVGIADERVITLAAVAGSIAFAMFLNAFVGARVERLRGKLRRRGALRASSPAALLEGAGSLKAST